MKTRHLVDPEIADALARLPVELGRFTSAEEVAALRATRADLYARLASPRGADHRTLGEWPVTVRVFRPDGEGAEAGPNGRPGLLWIHGGGYMGGSRLIDDPLLDRWCGRFGAVTASVEYRLAPEHPYPAALDDCYTALRWLHHQAGALGLDSDRIGIGGISAGGGLAAALALLARDRGEVPVAFQVLVSPMLDDRPTASTAWDDALVWPPSANRIGWRAYLGARAGSTPLPPYAAAARADDLAGLPPAYVVVGAVEIFLDESVDHARRLAHAGVPTDLHVHAGVPHGFETMAPGAAVTRRAFRALEDWLGARLGRAPTAAAVSDAGS